MNFLSMGAKCGKALGWAGWFAVVLLVGPSARAEEAKAKISVTEHGWTEAGDLVLGVKIQAGDKGLQLGSLTEKSGTIVDHAFSMQKSVLVDGYTQKTLAPLSSLPRKPFFGTNAGVINLEPGDAITFGVAFPKPSEPPKVENGNMLDYRFVIQIPNFPAVEFTLPSRKAAAP